MRNFLSDPEVDWLRETVEVYDPGLEHFQVDPESDDPTLSLQYWPERSDCSLAELELGWPDSSAYRGVTRVNVYTQPPLHEPTHVKEMIRRTIAQAQKVGGLNHTIGKKRYL